MTKQNIRLVTVDSALELWLLEKLLQEPLTVHVHRNF